jgi:altronate hydrolase
VGHKVALKDISRGEKVVKYGYPVGITLTDIKKDGHVHTHNMKTGLDEPGDYGYDGPPEAQVHEESLFFNGYERRNGRVGTRNEIWIIPTVGCVNKIAEKIAEKASRFYEATYAFTHPYGCSQLGDDHRNTQKVLAGLVRHPNAAGVLVLGLGCENNNIGEFRKFLGGIDGEKVKFLNCQDESDEIGKALDIIQKLAKRAKTFKRSEVPLSRLAIGLKCGGSDAFSGITANPLAGYVSDRIVSMDGTAILTEIPEMFGAEQILAGRCLNRGVFDRYREVLESFKKYYAGHGQKIYENPSPGNKEGGITTLEEKSLGCVQKGGAGIVSEVFRYGELAAEGKGLVVLEGPGNDIVAQTALAAAGAQIIIFTTGRGTPLGAPVPTIKVSSNTGLYEKKGNWIDFDAGVMFEKGSLEETGREFFDYVIKVASGLKTANERNGFREIAIFKNGVTL